MTRRIVVRIAAVAGLALTLSGCGSSDADFHKYAEKKGFNEEDTAAFMVCAKQLNSNKPIFAVSGGNMVMKQLPLDICGCHAKVMSSLFVQDQYLGYNSFAVYMAKDVKKYPPRFAKKDLKPNIKAKEVEPKLEATLKSCVDDYQNAHPDQAKLLFDIVAPAPDPKAAKKTT